MSTAAIGDSGPVPAPKISLRDVTKRHDTQLALDRITLDIPASTFFVVVGPSGCGKTTLLRMLAGLDAPSEGQIDIANSQPGHPQNSMVFQGDSLFPWMTVWDNAAYGLTMRNVPKARIDDVVGHYLNKTGMYGARTLYPHQLSGGMRQRVSIARAFANDPDILLMDEPFSALDEQNKTLLHEELLRIWEETRKTVVFITHSVDEAVTLGDRIMVMTAGPGRIKTIVPVDLPRPRNVVELRHTPAYGELVYDIWAQLREEVDRARSREPGSKA
ncbi:NitT/TauT family transport system ATP-binding protein [Tardiphaga robiniae]|uniref:ABC transporter ATP-binding protein n=1 Tax=Tardiphaga robiniae TaxID=943830 RepID=UPI0028652318|nr:ABC transporter ATP-binding protein [Tardiphaga robiniae]MDR6662988.1 NitT/TauT family transport system ATP-binding protein [Tardiphaga robiniae]